MPELLPDHHAATAPDKPAVVMTGSGESVTYGDLVGRSRQLAQFFASRGYSTGTHLAILLPNDARYFEIVFAGLRSGFYVTPINWHLGTGEAGYIIENCDAEILITSSAFAEVIAGMSGDLDKVTTRLTIDGGIDGFELYDDVLSGQPNEPLANETEGAFMLYSSGTTGRPKGVLPPLSGAPFGTGSPIDMLTAGFYGMGTHSRYLCPAPLYHAAPLYWSCSALRLGGTVYVMERFEAGAALDAIGTYSIDIGQFVPTHFVRMLKLDDERRAGANVSSMKTAVHAAAPCPDEVKRAMLEWWGPVIYEYYSGSEGNGFFAIGPDEWLEHPGSVGRPLIGIPHIVDDDGAEVAAGEVGQIWFEGPSRFEYHKDPEKTASVFDARGWSTLGDIGYLDGDGYLYLTDRVSHMIISGGVNIYPQEVEDVLTLHPAVADVAVIGVPDPEMGEQVKAVVQAADPDQAGADLAEELIGYCRQSLAGYKCPRSVDFVDELPRLPTGKLLKRTLRDRYENNAD